MYAVDRHWHDHGSLTVCSTKCITPLVRGLGDLDDTACLTTTGGDRTANLAGGMQAQD
jgi:hypothetical protein